MIRRAEFGLWPLRARRQFAAVSSGIRSDPRNWTDPRHQRGLAAEAQAIRYLQARGWEVVAHRFRVGRVEVDLIARRGALVAFVEVKGRRGLAFGSPFEAVTGAKRRGNVKTARVWVGPYGQRGDGDRLDCIGIVYNKLENLEGALRPWWGGRGVWCR